MALSADGFWRIIETARRVADGDAEGTGEAVQAALSARSATDIRDFARHLNDCMSRSYTGAIAEAFVVMTGGPENGFSNDFFECFRAWLITRGREVFEGVLVDPDTLAELGVEHPVEECCCETLLPAPDAAFVEQSNGEDAGLVDLDVTRGTVPPGAEAVGGKPRLPRLAAMYRAS